MNKMFNFNGMPRKRSGHAGGKSVSMIGMLVLLMAALLVLPSCFDDDDTETVEGPTKYVCTGGPDDGKQVDSKDDCSPATTPPVQCHDGSTAPSTDQCPKVSQYDRTATGTDMWMGSDDVDKVKGDEADNNIHSRGGDDEVNGMGGNDEIHGGAGDDTLKGGGGDDTIHGNDGDDTIHGNDGDDVIAGDKGDDTIDGGGNGVKGDTAKYVMEVKTGSMVGFDQPVVASLPEPGKEGSVLDDGFNGRDTISNIENLHCASPAGTTLSDSHETSVEFTGNSQNNHLMGCAGNDTLKGGGGNDTLEGRGGADMLDGGAGMDTASYKMASAVVTVNLATVDGADGAGEAEGDTFEMVEVDHDNNEDTPKIEISTVENIVGSDIDGTDNLTGDEGPNMLYGGAGADILNGGAGNDTLYGDAGADDLNGGAGNDTLYGGAGADSLDGGAGDDMYMMVDSGTGTASDTFESSDDGMDTVKYATPKHDDDKNTENVDESMRGIGNFTGDAPAADGTTPSEVEMVYATPKNDYIEAAGTGVTIVGLGGEDNITGGAGVDTLIGCAGKNTLIGSGGIDVFGVVNDGGNYDTITDFVAGEEVHLKGFPAGSPDPTFDEIAGSDDSVHIKVGTQVVAVVMTNATGGTEIVADTQMAGDTVAKAIIRALGDEKDTADGKVKLVRHVSKNPCVTE